MTATSKPPAAPLLVEEDVSKETKSREWAAWQRLIHLRKEFGESYGIPDGAFFSPSKNSESFYSKKLKEDLKLLKQAGKVPQEDPALKSEAATIAATYQALLAATLQGDNNLIDALMARTYRQGIPRERTQSELLRRWAEHRGITLSKPTTATSGNGRIIGRAEPGRGIEQLQPGFLLDHDLHVLVADAGTGKTFLTLELSAVVSGGAHGFLDQQAPRNGGGDRRTVLYIASDGGPSAWPMISDYSDLLEIADRPAEIEVWAESDDGSESAWDLSIPNLERLAARIAVGDLLGVVIDTANSVFQNAGLNPYTGPVDSYLRLLKAIVCPRAFLWINHHTNRSGQGLKSIGGHPAWQEVPAVLHRIERQKGNDGDAHTYRWHVEKFRGESPRSFSYQRRNGAFELVEGVFHENVGMALLALIDKRKKAGMATNPAALIEACGKSSGSVYTALSRLRQARLIRSQGNAHWLTAEGERRLAIAARGCPPLR